MIVLCDSDDVSFGVPADEDTQLSLAHQLYKSGSYKQALEHSNAVYERNPLRTDNLLLLGAIYYQVLFLEPFLVTVIMSYLFLNVFLSI